MAAIGLDTRVSPARNVVTRDLGDGLIVMEVGSGLCWELNRTGVAMWKNLSEGKSVRETATVLAGDFPVSAERLEVDTLALVRDLLAAGLLALA
jgi:hypothetical protein